MLVVGSKLEQLLSYLRRDDVIQLRFRSDEPVMLHTTRRAHAVTVTPLSAPQIRLFFEDTDVAARLSPTHAQSSRDSAALAGVQHDVEVTNVDGVLTVSVRLEDPAEGALGPGNRADNTADTADTRDDLRAARSTRQGPSVVVAQPTAYPTPSPASFATITPIPQGGLHGRALPTSASARFTAALVSARGRRARQVLLSPGRTVRLRVGQTWVDGGTTVSSKDIESGLRSLLELRHHERLASRGHVSRSVDMGAAGRWKLRVLRQSSELQLRFDSTLDAPPQLGAAIADSALTAWMQRGHGLSVMTGAPGSGKTTAIASFIAATSAACRQRIAWVSSGSEFDMQVLGAATTWFEAWPPSRSWVPTLRAALDQSPDTIVIDGLRDGETAAEALRAASSRARVIVGLDAPSIAAGVRRLVRLAEASGVHDAPDLVASTLRFASTPAWQEQPPSERALLHLRLAEVSASMQQAIRSDDRIALELAEQDLPHLGDGERA